MAEIIRQFTKKDIPELLRLMKELATFEDYIDDLKITEADIEERGLSDPPQFYAFVAEQNSEVVGMAVLYIIPFTMRLKPNLVLKEFYVQENARGNGLGERLFNACKGFAHKIGAGQIIWTVMDGNERAEKFYALHGAKADTKWKNWVYTVERAS